MEPIQGSDDNVSLTVESVKQHIADLCWQLYLKDVLIAKLRQRIKELEDAAE